MKAALFLALVGFAVSSPDFKDIEAKFGHRVDVRQSAFTDPARGYKIQGIAAGKEAIEKYAPLWIKEWSRYPGGLMAKAKVSRVVFAEKLSLNGQIRAAVPAFDLDAMYFDPALGAHSPGYQRSVIHHEFFHMMDYRMGKLKVDPEWAALNPQGFKYGEGGAKMRTSGVGNLTKDIPGFLTLYGTAALEEDKAELFAHLIVNPKFVMAQAETDSVLAAKIGLLKRRMREYDAGFSEEFWPRE